MAERISEEAVNQIVKEKQRAEQLYKEKLQTLQRMRKAGLSDVNICIFLNISSEELERMTNFPNDE